MGRNKDNAPVGNTCPMIDEVISAIESADWSEVSFHTAESVKEIMEKIRSANLELRNWGNEECNRANSFERDFDDAERTVKAQKEDLKFYIGENESLIKELNDAQFQLNPPF